MKTGFFKGILWWLVFLVWSAALLQLSYGFFGDHIRFLTERPVELEYMSFVKHFAVFFIVFGLSYVATNLLFHGRTGGRDKTAKTNTTAPPPPPSEPPKT